MKRLIYPGVLDIYRPYVLHTYITFEYYVPTLEEFSEKVSIITAQYPWLVCTQNETIIGYAYGSEHRHRTAYQWSAESTIYLKAEFQGKGIGAILYQSLFDILRLQGFYNVYAGVGLPNERSERLHKSLGFEELGIFKNIGYKLGKWHDTKWFHLPLRQHVPDPSAPLLIRDIQMRPDFLAILQAAGGALIFFQIP